MVSIKIFLFVTVIANSQCSITVNKCCDKGMIFERGLKCVTIPDGYQTDKFNWFPMDSIVDVTTLKVHKSRRNDYVRMLEKVSVKYGKRPECDNSNLDLINFSAEKPLFNFLLHKSHMEVYIGTNKSVHHPNGIHLFPMAADDKNEVSSHSDRQFKLGDLRRFALNEVCVDAILNSNRHRLLICPCNSTTCIRKCCGDEKYYNVTSQTCEDITSLVGNPVQKWRPQRIGFTP
ncbi:hypothetical protein RUM43_014679 [Polyplax serrata]|uniref:Methuselah N-terminal domain-containing protein n=1 Tax=Polyplax serrata TaxID=468196 RepID=A0AAN8RYQ5_POLSC